MAKESRRQAPQHGASSSGDASGSSRAIGKRSQETCGRRLGDLAPFLERALESCLSALALADVDGRLFFANPAFLELWGYDTEQEILDRPLTDFFSETRVAREALDLLRKQNDFSGELLARRPDDSLFRIKMRAWRVHDQHGAPLGLAASFRDISCQCQALEALRDSENRYKSMVEATSDWLWELSPRGVFTYVSPQVRHILGREPEEFLGESLFSLVAQEQAESLRERFLHHVQAQIPFSRMQLRMHSADERDICLESNGVPVYDEFLRFTGFRGVSRDVTPRKRAEQLLQRERQRLEARILHLEHELAAAGHPRQETDCCAVLSTQTDMVLRCRADGAVTFANDRLRSHLGLDTDELSRGCCHWLHGFQATKELTTQKPEAVTEQRLTAVNGCECWQEWVHKGLFDEQGTLVEIQSEGRDITTRVQAREQLTRALKTNSELKQRMEAVIQSISDGILYVDREMRLVQRNQALDAICSSLSLLTEGDCIADVFDEKESPPCFELLQQVLATRKSVRGYRAQCGCGSRPRQITMLNASPVLDHDNRFTGAVLVIRDITRLETLERHLGESGGYRNIIGGCKKMQDVYAILRQLADLKTTVLITGESGTGKELVVEALHYSSSSITGPLIKVNCAALAENLLESELFGHVRGAFTGAVSDKVGRFQAAEGGTIFLDEIGDLSLNMQLKLLRVLENKEFERVGDSTTCKADVRVVTATNVNLWERVEQGLFREDLYYRLKVMIIDLPPLRERGKDIMLLAEHFIRHYGKAFNKDLQGMSGEVASIFTHYPWYGNVRELKHTVEHASILCQGGPIALQHLPADLRSFASRLDTQLPSESQNIEHDMLISVLERCHWNKTKASQLMGISRTTLYRKMVEYGIKG